MIKKIENNVNLYLNLEKNEKIEIKKYYLPFNMWFAITILCISEVPS